MSVARPICVVLLLAVLSVVSSAAATPNIVFIMVDQMRFPMHLPKGISSADEYIAKFMPNLNVLWRYGSQLRVIWTYSKLQEWCKARKSLDLFGRLLSFS